MVMHLPQQMFDAESYPELGAWAALALEQAAQQHQAAQLFQAQQQAQQQALQEAEQLRQQLHEPPLTPQNFWAPPIVPTAQRPVLEKRNFNADGTADADGDHGAKRACH